MYVCMSVKVIAMLIIHTISRVPYASTHAHMHKIKPESLAVAKGPSIASETLSFQALLCAKSQYWQIHLGRANTLRLGCAMLKDEGVAT